MLRILHLASDGSVLESTDPSLASAPAEGTFRWLDLCEASDDELAAVGRAFGFHATALDDCQRFDQRPKLEPYDDHLFVVIHRLICSSDPPEARGAELHAFIGERYLVTVHEEKLGELDQIFERTLHEPETLRRGPDFWYYLLADRIVSSTYEELELIAQAVEDTEEHVLRGAQNNVIDRVFALKRQLAVARRLVSPERELFASLAKWGAPIIREKSVFYYRSVHDELVRAVESIESHRELLSNALDAHFSAVSQRTNEIMKHLTLLSSIFLPLTFVTGFFGMNFEHLPFGSDALMWSGIGACILLPSAMLFWFKTNRWI
ncbi:MAG TPA: magnesium transporter CorA family protein [Polyangiaceae bacterium]|jgi:magnesium transporter|nr:magnesium transporter CorA family protein [Polyangiaceae bacterium]